MSYNDLSENSGLVLAKSLENKSRLKILGLNNCKLSTEGVIAIAMAIGPHKALQELYLYSNGITSDGGIAIAKALRNK